MFYTHVNRGRIDSNRKHGKDEPVITIKKGKSGKAIYATEVEFPAGAKMIYSSEGVILPCGARCVIMSQEAPKVLK